MSPSIYRHTLAVLVVLVLTAIVSGCGQKGDLYRPEGAIPGTIPGTMPGTFTTAHA